jgi:hypothetical protein
MSENTSQPPGPSTDAQGRTAVDPTRNVKALSKSDTRRQDDLRHQDQLHIRAIAKLGRSHAKEIRTLESKRIDAILLNVADTARTTAAAAELRATALANQASITADAMRAQVAVVAQASNDTLDRRFGPIQNSIEEIRRFQFQSEGGKQQVVETRSTSTHWGVWVAIGVAVMVGMGTMLVSLISVGVLLYVNKP